MKHLILGSSSPRRKEILSYFTLPFEQVSPSFDEQSIPFRNNPVEYVTQLAKGKADSLERKHHEAIILTADTIVYYDGKIYGKPVDEENAFRALSILSGKWHSVFSGLCLIHHEKTFTLWEETKVLFNELTDYEIRHYHSKLHWADKAGGYAIQMAGGLIVKKINGCYYNVMGLPINSVRKLLLNVGIDLWNYLK